jgi:hypothetical protein
MLMMEHPVAIQLFTQHLTSLSQAPVKDLFEGRPGLLSMKDPAQLQDLLSVAGLPGAEYLPPPRRGIHGIKHLRMVAGLGVKLGLAEGLNPSVPQILENLWCLWVAGCLHDLGREDDGKDYGHADSGARIAGEYLQRLQVPAPLSSQIVRLIRNHGEEGETGLFPLDLIFKDADGLERHRLSPYDLDKSRLRTRTARAWSDEVHGLYWSRRVGSG